MFVSQSLATPFSRDFLSRWENNASSAVILLLLGTLGHLFTSLGLDPHSTLSQNRIGGDLGKNFEARFWSQLSMCVHTQWLKGHKSGDLSSLLALSWKHELSYGGTDAFIMSVLTYFCSIFYLKNISKWAVYFRPLQFEIMSTIWI